MTDIRARGEHAVQDLNGQGVGNPSLFDNLAVTPRENPRGEWNLPGPSRAKGYFGRVAVTDQRLLVQRQISANGWSTETIWQILISPQTRLETLAINTAYGARKGPLHYLRRGLSIVFGLPGLFFRP